MRAAKEREAQERVREQQRKREDQRQQEAARREGAKIATRSLQGAGVVVTRSLPVGTMGTSDRDDVDRSWAGMMGSRDSPPKVDPFVEQCGQLMSSIQQARQCGRHDEADILQASLVEIEQFMEQRGLRGVR